MQLLLNPSISLCAHSNSLDQIASPSRTSGIPPGPGSGPVTTPRTTSSRPAMPTADPIDDELARVLADLAAPAPAVLFGLDEDVMLVRLMPVPDCRCGSVVRGDRPAGRCHCHRLGTDGVGAASASSTPLTWPPL